MSRRLVWIDTDAGTDDASAILMLLSPSNDIDVIGISTVQGNVNVRQVSLNVLRLLQVADRTDIPVYEGTSRAILGDQIDASHYHGMDGFGDAPDPNAPTRDLIKPRRAVDALLEAAKRHKGELILLALGPLTNIAVALQLDPDFGKNLLSSYIMGGNYQGRGNISASAEFNFHADPEAAYVVLEHLSCPMTLACWELCLKYRLPWDWYKKVYTNSTTKKGQFIKKIEEQALRNFYVTNTTGCTSYTTADQLAAAALVENSVVKATEALYCTVELAGRRTRGQMVCDWGEFEKRKPNVRIITEMDEGRYMKLIEESVK